MKQYLQGLWNLCRVCGHKRKPKAVRSRTQIVKPMYENAVMVKDKTRTFPKDELEEEEELKELKKRIATLPEITIESPE